MFWSLENLITTFKSKIRLTEIIHSQRLTMIIKGINKVEIENLGWKIN